MKNFFKSHIVLCIVLACVLLLAAIWTPLIIMRLDKAPKKDNHNVSSVPTANNKEKIDDTRIICWGDSITAGMGMEKPQKYPSVLQTLVGNDYQVLNAGSSTESSDVIAARQGALEVFVAEDIVFGQGVATVKISNANNCGLVFFNGKNVRLNPGEAFTNDLPANELYINDVKYKLSVTSAGIHTLTRTDTSAPLTISKGEKVLFSSAKEQVGSYCGIFYVGANGGFGDTSEGLVELYKDMVEHHGNDYYLIILPTWTDKYDRALITAFGNKAINLKSTTDITRIMEDMNLTPTEEDWTYINKNLMPVSFTWENTPNDVHLNENGYRYMAAMVYERGVELEYWN